MEKTWTDFLWILLASGSGAALASIGWDFWRHYRSRSESVRYLATRLAFAFEEYAISCANKLADHQLAQQSSGHVGSFVANVPEFPGPIESAHYELMKPDLLGRLLDFPQRCNMADRAAQFWWEAAGDMDCVRESAYENMVEMGRLAIGLSVDIRGEYSLGQRDLTFDEWDIPHFFDEQQKRVDQLKAQRAAAQSES